MKETIAICSLIGLLSLPSLAFGYGEGDTIPYNARAIHLLVNEARCNPPEALKKCGDNCGEGVNCYKDPREPLYWHDDLSASAQFFANMSGYASCMQHDTPCTLKSDIASKYPDKCDGNPSCACEGGSATCHSKGTEWNKRIALFSKAHGSGGENIAYSSSHSASIKPLSTFNQWILEKSTDTKCGYNSENGHRYNILNPNYHAIGIGVSTTNTKSYYSVQDFGSKYDGEKNPLTSGSHYLDLDGETLNFKTHYFSDVKAHKVSLRINDTCVDLSKTRGSDTNGVYGTTKVKMPEKCTPYFFEAIAEDGTISRYPTSGSLLFSLDGTPQKCDKSWENKSSGNCLGAKDLGSSDSCSGNPVRGSGSLPWMIVLGCLASLFTIRKRHLQN